MTNATINNFFGGNLEEEVLEEVVILPFTGVNYKAGYSVQIAAVDFSTLDHVIVGMSGFDGVGLNATITVDGSYLKQSSWTVTGIVDDSKATTSARVALVKTDNNIEVVVDARLGNMPQAGVKYITGYKRRIARVGLDELMSSMGLPNLVANCDLTDNPINQRGFDGNWANLAIGAYGYDQWIKVSNSHMGYVIEEGKYRPNAKHTMTVNDVVIKEFTSPASGHFVVAVPFANIGKFDIYAGRFKRPWHPVQDGTSLCQRFYQLGNASAERLTSVFSESVPFQTRGLVTLTPPVRNIVTPTASNPEWFSVGQNAWSKDGIITLAMRGNDSLRVNLSVPNATATRYQCVIVKFGYVVDASIPWAELSSNVIIAL